MSVSTHTYLCTNGKEDDRFGICVVHFLINRTGARNQSTTAPPEARHPRVCRVEGTIYPTSLGVRGERSDQGLAERKFQPFHNGMLSQLDLEGTREQSRKNDEHVGI